MDAKTPDLTTRVRAKVWRTERGRLRAIVQLAIVVAVIGTVANPLVLLLDATDDPLLESSLKNVCMLIAVAAALGIVARLDRRRLSEFGLGLPRGLVWRLAIRATVGAGLMSAIVATAHWASGAVIHLEPRTRFDVQIGAHFAWNVMQNNVFGLPNGGQPSNAAVFSVSESPHPLLSGGSFGPEGGLVTTAVLAVAAILLRRVVMNRSPAWRVAQDEREQNAAACRPLPAATRRRS